MDELQIYLSIIIPLIVSVFAWMLTYIIPYIMPNQVSKIVLFFTKTYDPTDPIEIGLLINQFLKYDDWKRLNAKYRLERIFKIKMDDIYEEQVIEWNNLKNNVICEPLSDTLNELELAISKAEDETNNQEHVNLIHNKTNSIALDKPTNALRPSNLDSLKKDQKICSDIYKKHENAQLWYFEKNPIKYREILNKGKSSLTTHQIGVLKGLDIKLLDEDGSTTVESFIKTKLKKDPPKRQNEKEIDTTFNDIILYIDYLNYKSKTEDLISRFALGLSNHEKSSETLLKFIEDIKSEIWTKDYNELRKQLDKM